MRLLHELAKIHATFDDPHLVSQAGLVPVMAGSLRAVEFSCCVTVWPSAGCPCSMRLL